LPEIEVMREAHIILQIILNVNKLTIIFINKEHKYEEKNNNKKHKFISNTKKKMI
jgi:hypothetical protein